MKKVFLLSVLLYCCSVGLLAKPCTVNYHIRNFPNFKFIDFVGEGATNGLHRDNTGKADGTFTVNIDEPTLIFAATTHTYPYKYAMFWLHEGVVDITIDSNMNLSFKNSDLNDDYLVFKNYADSLLTIKIPLYDKIYSDSTLSQLQKDSLNAIVDVADAKYADFQYKLLLKNTSSFLALNFLQFYVPTAKYERQKLETLFNVLDTSLYKYATYSNIKTALAVTHKKYEEGDIIDYLPLTNLKGKAVDFSTLLGKKYLYIVNWSTGCHFCAPNNEKLKIAYKKLKSKVTIIGVSSDTNKVSLFNYLKNEKLKWKNYCDFKGMLSIPDMLLNSDFTPNGTLVAPNGKIIKKNINPIEDADKFVSEINELIK